MDKIRFCNNEPLHINNASVQQYVEQIKKQGDQLLKKCQKGKVDYIVEITHMDMFQSYWIRLLFFFKDKPTHTFALFTVRVFSSDFPVSLDMNFIEESDFDVSELNCQEDKIDTEEGTFECFSEEDFEEKVSYLSKIAFEKLLNNLQRK